MLDVGEYIANLAAMKKNRQFFVRRAHRWLGVSIGVQFLFWTISGLYFSWTDIDQIHGDYFRTEVPAPAVDLSKIASLGEIGPVHSIALRVIGEESYLWVNDSLLVAVESGKVVPGITEVQATALAREQVLDEFEIAGVTLLTEVGPHHEYRGRPLPAYAVAFEGPERLTAYITQRDGHFERVRHRNWRWFDFLWMFHTMDYQGRDDFNNFLLRAFSLFGLFLATNSKQ